MILEINNLRKGYGVSGSAGYREILSGLDLTVRPGQSIAITGPSGSGKTTLLNLIAALDSPDEGIISYKGLTVNNLNQNELDEYRNRSIGMVFQLHHLLPQFTLLENVLLPTLPLRDQKQREVARDRAEQLLHRMGVWEVRNQRPAELSGGECQRTAVARALINNPDLLLADEPTGALDQDNATLMAQLLAEISQTDGKAVILVTHSVDLAGQMDAVYHLDRGILVADNQTK
ncbi:MAG: ABC transporter ATP-binding protein [Bacteroidales bacterium]|jgi:ABC-type lipoprotein export system ATPase subunit|nr:ABC transporter ATP-binding protein [Bacteroidales bacterium]MDD2569750.1 ABC transporter ATP-binding protein [Bacteroidales bacterium]MDD2812598.1 ABC transporter ATP-binding protein [Bacteroidales bacterium]MDD3384148.1 ABC transporter ATP-binding protein [Bacteroidales bacterium]MDD3812475.1 ABC transporter ATP-binding protein [Bacteroidales bacterium]